MKKQKELQCQEVHQNFHTWMKANIVIVHQNGIFYIKTLGRN